MRRRRSRRRPGRRGGGHHAGARRAFGRGDREVALRASARIGETLPPAARPLLARLAVWEPIPCRRASAFARRPFGRGARTSCTRLTSSSIPTGKAGISIGSDSIRCWLSAARQAGAHLCCGAQVTSCLPLAVGGWQVEFTSGASGRASHQLRARVLIDATGRAAVAGAPARRQAAQCRSAGWARRRAGRSSARERAAGDECDACTLVEACADGWWYSALLPRGRLMAVYMTDADLLRRHRAVVACVLARAIAADDAHARATARVRSADRPARGRGQQLTARSRRAGAAGWPSGDAAMAFDPLSSQGLMQALASGIRAGEALDPSLAGEAAAIERVRQQGKDAFREYSRLRAVYYGREQRWPQSVFWRRRHAAARVIGRRRDVAGSRHLGKEAKMSKIDIAGAESS